MAGIASYAAYVPPTRLPLALIAGRTGKPGGPEKAVAGDDEDALTLGVAAAIACLDGFDRDSIDAVLFASTSHPLREKQAAATLAKALDLRRDVLAGDHAGSLRAGIGALQAGLDAVAAGSARNVLVVASDCRMGAPRGALEAKLGDAAAAFLVSGRDAIADFEAGAAVADELQDVWRVEGEPFTHTWEERFAIQEGYQPNLAEAVERLLRKLSCEASDVHKAALYAPDERSLAEATRNLGFAPAQVQDAFFGRIGNAGTAFAPLLLAAALESARPGERLLVAGYGDGAHALSFRTTAAIEKLEPRRGVSWHLARRRALGSYDAWLRARGLQPQEWPQGPDLGLSATVRFRDRDADIAFAGARCRACGLVHFPAQRVCYRCFTKDQWERFRLSDQHGRVLSYTFDYFFPAAEPPTVVVMTEVEGCRVQVQLANARPEQVSLDLPVEYVFRKIHDAGGKPNYFWKASPLEVR